MFLCLLPLAHIDHRLSTSDLVMASDASLLGGGVCASQGETSLGVQVSQGAFRGEDHRDTPDGGVVCIGLFDDMSAVRVSLEAIHAFVALHVSVGNGTSARRVVESNFPDTIFVDEVANITPAMCQVWAGLASTAKLILIGAGAPSHRSVNSSVRPFVDMVRKAFSWCPLHFLQESVASLDAQTRVALTREADVIPYRICASELSPSRRDRLYWFTWALEHEEGVELHPPQSGDPATYGRVCFTNHVKHVGCLEPGWALHPKAGCLTTFTAAQPSQTNRDKPAGIARCSAQALDRWAADRHRFPPYQYKDENLLWHPNKPPRTPSVQERERCLGFPTGYTRNVLPKNEAKGNPQKMEDIQMTLLGNTWSVAVVAFLLLQLLRPLGLCVTESLHQLLSSLFGGLPIFSNTLLSWHPLGESFISHPSGSGGRLVPKLLTLLSGKGSDIMLQVGAEVQDHQRFSGIDSSPSLVLEDHLWMAMASHRKGSHKSLRTPCGLYGSAMAGSPAKRAENPFHPFD